MSKGEWLLDYVRAFADKLEQSVMERERERAAMICHACRDLPAEQIAERILGRAG